MGTLVAVLGGLTGRGRALALAGLVCGVAAYGLGSPDLLRVAVFLVVLPLVASLLVTRSRHALSVQRTLEPARVGVGDVAHVTLTLGSASRLPSGALLLEDRLPWALGGPPRFVLDRLEPGTPRRVGYALHPAQRGRSRVGPLHVRLTDPFGLCELPRAFPGVDELVVTPAVEPLPTVALPAGAGRGGDAGGGGVAVSGQDDAALREYRSGDDLRRVHWRASARLGELVVRREEQPRQTRTAVLLDTRLGAHTGEGRTSTLEAAVSAAASVVSHLAGTGWNLRLLRADGHELARGSGAAVTATALDALAVAEAERASGLEAGLAGLALQDEGLLVAVLGALRPGDLDALAAVPSRGTPRLALLTAVDGSRRGATPPAEAARVLAAAGWRVARTPPAQPLAAAWAGLGGGGGAAAPTGAAPPGGPARRAAASAGGAR